jgi:STE24 endopeptidase
LPAIAVWSPAAASRVDRRFDHLAAARLDTLAQRAEPDRPVDPRGGGAPAGAGHRFGGGMAPSTPGVHDVGTMRDAIDAGSAGAGRRRGAADAATPAGRHVTGTALAMFSTVVLIWCLSHVLVAPLALVAGELALGDRWTGLALGSLLWTLSGALVLVRPIETFVGRLLFRLRRPNREELTRLTPIWLGVCHRAGADPARFLLRVEQGETLNAFAIGGHFVAVTRAALRLPDDMLEAVIAHELGHHRELHPVATGLGWWYGLPFQAADWLLRRIRLTTAFLARVFAYLRAGGRSGGIDGLLGILAAMVVVGTLVVAGMVAVLLLGLVWLPLALVVWTSRLLSAALSRAAEYAADRHAVELGYGPGLTRMLELLLRTEQGTPMPHGLRALLRSHPRCQERLAAIRDLAALAAAGGGRGGQDR